MLKLKFTIYLGMLWHLKYTVFIQKLKIYLITFQIIDSHQWCIRCVSDSLSCDQFSPSASTAHHLMCSSGGIQTVSACSGCSRGYPASYSYRTASNTSCSSPYPQWVLQKDSSIFEKIFPYGLEILVPLQHITRYVQ